LKIKGPGDFGATGTFITGALGPGAYEWDDMEIPRGADLVCAGD